MAGEPGGSTDEETSAALDHRARPDPAVVSGAGSQPVNAPGRLAGHLGPRQGHVHARGHDLEIDGATTRCRLRGQEREAGLLPGALILAGGLNGIQVMEVPRWRSPPAAWPSASPPASRR